METAGLVIRYFKRNRFEIIFSNTDQNWCYELIIHSPYLGTETVIWKVVVSFNEVRDLCRGCLLTGTHNLATVTGYWSLRAQNTL